MVKSLLYGLGGVHRIDDFQQTYFVLDRLDDLLRLAEIDFAPLYEQVGRLDTLPADAVLPQDTVITRGVSSDTKI